MGGAGVQRSLKFSKYLPDFDILPTIVCAESDAYPHDYSLLEEVPNGIDVTRITHTPTASRIVSLLRRTSTRTPASSARRAAIKERQTEAGARWRDSLLSAWAAMQFPDDKAAWARQARRMAKEVMAERPVDIVYSSSPPVSAHWAAMRLASEVGIPWVADFRDLWTGNPAYKMPAWRRAIDRRQEQRILASADGIVTVTSSMASELLGFAGPAARTRCIPNGYDEDDFTGLEPVPREPGIFRIVYTGTFYGHRSPAPFLLGVQRLLEQHHALRERVRVRFIGSIGTRFDSLLNDFSDRFPGVLELRGYVSHSEALSEALAADVLLLVVGGDSHTAAGVMTGKIFEYLRAGRPILLIGPDRSEAAQLIRECGAGEVIDAHRTDDIAAVIDRWASRDSLPRLARERVAAFERRDLTLQLAEFLVEVHQRFHEQDQSRQ
jgi:glycosyltransferase involved in cell wall biosynthesis